MTHTTDNIKQSLIEQSLIEGLAQSTTTEQARHYYLTRFEPNNFPPKLTHGETGCSKEQHKEMLANALPPYTVEYGTYAGYSIHSKGTTETLYDALMFSLVVTKNPSNYAVISSANGTVIWAGIKDTPGVVEHLQTTELAEPSGSPTNSSDS